MYLISIFAHRMICVCARVCVRVVLRYRHTWCVVSCAYTHTHWHEITTSPIQATKNSDVDQSSLQRSRPENCRRLYNRPVIQARNQACIHHQHLHSNLNGRRNSERAVPYNKSRMMYRVQYTIYQSYTTVHRMLYIVL